MVKVLWRSDSIHNPVGVEARIIEVDGDRVLEARFAPGLRLKQKLKAIKNILIGKEYVIATIYGGIDVEEESADNL